MKCYMDYRMLHIYQFIGAFSQLLGADCTDIVIHGGNIVFFLQPMLLFLLSHILFITVTQWNNIEGFVWLVLCIRWHFFDIFLDFIDSLSHYLCESFVWLYFFFFSLFNKIITYKKDEAILMECGEFATTLAMMKLLCAKDFYSLCTFSEFLCLVLEPACN